MISRSKIKEYFLPKYDETALFIMALSFSFLLVTDSQLKGQIASNFNARDPFHYLIAGMFTFGLMLSLCHMVSSRAKSAREKYLMLYFAVLANASSGIIAAFYLHEQTGGALLIFPAINFLNSVLLISFMSEKVITHENISDRNSSKLELVLSIIAVIVLLIILHRIYDMHWAIIFSLIVFYATNINTLVLGALSLFSHNKLLKRDSRPDGPPAA